MINHLREAFKFYINCNANFTLLCLKQRMLKNYPRFSTTTSLQSQVHLRLD
jgi:hypothetical protein